MASPRRPSSAQLAPRRLRSRRACRASGIGCCPRVVAEGTSSRHPESRRCRPRCSEGRRQQMRCRPHLGRRCRPSLRPRPPPPPRASRSATPPPTPRMRRQGRRRRRRCGRTRTMPRLPGCARGARPRETRRREPRHRDLHVPGLCRRSSMVPPASSGASVLAAAVASRVSGTAPLFMGRLRRPRPLPGAGPGRPSSSPWARPCCGRRRSCGRRKRRRKRRRGRRRMRRRRRSRRSRPSYQRGCGSRG
mmetsp:Transcript_114847/g.365068  ORF Transcript_114847/g.365068 Transcript_114847/m.365068 type:complete len:248 (-) Transcript_114847:1144-1887(-)